MKLSSKKHKLIFSVGDDGCIISCFLGGTLVKRVFAVNPLSSEFEDICRNYPAAEIFIILDSIDQTFNTALIPPVSGGYRKKIINRKIASEFDKNDINSYIKMGRENNQRKDWKYLFLSVRYASPISDWVEAIIELPNDFGGLYLFPLEAIDFIGKIRNIHLKSEPEKKTPTWEILVSHNRVGGIRQVVLKEGIFVFTRISQLNHSNQDITSLSSLISQEATNTLEFIRRIGYQDEESLDIYFISSKEVVKEIDVVATGSISTHKYYPYQLAQEFSYENVAQENDRFCDVIFAANFVNAKKKYLKLDTPKTAYVSKLKAGLSAIKGFTIFIGLALMIGSGYMLYEALSNSSHKKEIEDQITTLRTQLDNSKDFEKEFGLKPENIIEMVKLNTDNEKLDQKFFDIVKKISEVDLRGSKTSKIEYKKSDAGIDVIMDFAFDMGANKNLSDLIVDTDNFSNAMKAALKDYQVTITGLPSERKEFKINENPSATDNSIRIGLTVKSSN